MMRGKNFLFSISFWSGKWKFFQKHFYLVKGCQILYLGRFRLDERVEFFFSIFSLNQKRKMIYFQYIYWIEREEILICNLFLIWRREFFQILVGNFFFIVRGIFLFLSCVYSFRKIDGTENGDVLVDPKFGTTSYFVIFNILSNFSIELKRGKMMYFHTFLEVKIGGILIFNFLLMWTTDVVYFSQFFWVEREAIFYFQHY